MGGKRFHSSAAWALLAVLPAHLLAQSAPILPKGGNFAAGTGAIGSLSGNTLNITQSSARGVIDWSSFSIGAGGRVVFNNGNGATLNRVSGGNLSQIEGLLQATGSLYLINQNGIIIGPNSCILANGSFVASTRDINTENFMAGGSLSASGTSAGNVTNQGKIVAHQGDVVLIGQSVENSGSISAPNGTATLATGDNLLLTTVGGPAGVYVSPDVSKAGNLTQSGRIEAAAAALKAGGGDIYTLAGNRNGLISATGTQTVNGQVWLSAPNGSITAGGTISARGADGSGGTVIVKGANVIVPDDARISAAGLTGGIIETSGHSFSIGKATINAGRGGTWLVDPTDLNIDAAAASTIVSSLNSGTNVTEQTTSGPGPDPGDINVNSAINWTGTGALTLSAYHDLNLNAPVSGAGGFTGQAGGGVNVNANVSAASVLLNATGGNLTLAPGLTVAGASGVTLQTAGNFVNNAGANALSAGTGNWLVYSTNPSADTTGGLTPNYLQYAAPAGTTPAASGNGLLYSVTPSLTTTLSGTVEKTYDGTTSAAFTNANANVGGLINGDTATVTGSYASKDAGSGIGVTASNIAVGHGGIPVYGYNGTTPSVSAAIGQIDPATLTATIAGNPTKTYNATTTATLNSANYQINGFVNGEGATVNQPSSVAYDSPEAGNRTISATFSPTNFAPTNGTNLSNYVLPTSAIGPGYINPAPLLISGVLATDKTYDGTTSDALSTSAAALYGIVGSDDVSLIKSGASGTFTSPNAGSNLAVSASGFALSGTKAADYALAQPSGLTASINPAQLTISGVTANNKVYDATTNATMTVSGATLNGVVASDSLTLGSGGATGTFATSDVGSGIPVTASGFTFSGSGAQNYRLTQPSGLAADITARPISVAITGTPAKTYNGDATAQVSSTGYSLSGFVSGQSATINQAANLTYASANAGTQTVTATLAISDYSPGSGTKLSNYTLPTSATGSGTINPAPITVSLAGDPTKTYDGNTSASLNASNFLLSGFLAGQSATVTQTSGFYDSPNAGTRQVTATLAPGNFSPGSGTVLTNYSFPTSVTGFGTIVPAPLQGGISAAITGDPTKTYDGTTVATLTPSDFTLSGFAQGQGATVTQTAGTYASKNAGVQPVTASLSPPDFTPNNGTDLSNYTLPTTAYGSGTINPAVLTAAIIGTPTKVYNGTLDATLSSSNFSISGLANGEGVTIGNSVPGTYDAKQAGARTVTASIASTDITPQGNTLLSNYVLPASATGPGQINQAPLSILGVSAQNKTYDTTTANTLSTGGAHLFGVVGSDDVSLSSSGSSGVFASPNAGSGIPVTASGFNIGGADSSNYQLSQPTGLSATIYKAPLSIAGVTANDKFYDNTMAATLNTGSAALSGVLPADNGKVGLDASGNTASFSSVNVGNNLAVAAGGFALNGTQAANYSLSQPSGLTANINPQPLVANIIGNPTKVYDGSTSTTLTAANYQLVGFVSGQGASLPQSASAQYLSPNAGSEAIRSTLATSDFVANAGTNLSNYVLPTNGNGTGTITPAPLTAGIVGNPTKTYDSTTAATLSSSNYTLSGFISGQSATVTQTSGVYSAPDAGSRSVTATLASGDFSSGNGTNLNNYSLPTSATGPGTINKAPLQVVGVAGTDRAYNGGVADTLNVSSAGVSGLFGSDTVNLNTAGASGTFASKDAGTGIPVSAAGFSISGGQSNDYSLLQPTGLSADITAATLNLIQVTRQYDSTTGLPSLSSAYTLSGIFGSDDVSVNTGGITGSYADKNVGSGKSVTLSGLALTGAQASDYSVAASLSNAPVGVITKAPLTVAGVVADNKVYDATTAATLDNSSASLSGLFAGDAVTLDTSGASAVFSDKNVGNNKTVTSSGYNASGADYGNYNFTQPTGLTANITPYSGISLASVTKTYDGGTSLPTASSAYALNGLLGSDSVQVATASLSGSYASQNVGQNLGITLSGLGLTGTDAANYSIASTLSNAAIGIINPKQLSASIAGTPTKTYDTTTAATLVPGNYSVSGFVSGEGASVTQTSGTYSSPNAGTPTVSATLAAGDFNPDNGTLLSNYTLPTSASGAGRINQAPVTITGVQATNKTYDGTTSDTLNTGSAALSGVYASDSGSVTLNSGGTGTFASKNVGTGIGVTAAGFSIGGTKAGNYSLSQPTGLSANITQDTLTLASVTKVYDATTTAVGAGVSYTLGGVLGADSVSLNTTNLAGTYAAKNAGSGLDVTMTGLALTGPQAGNYSIGSSVTNDPIGTITKAPLSVVGEVAVGKTYDSITAGSIDNTNTLLSGVLGSDSVNLFAPSTGTFASANAGNWTVTPGTYAISGTDAANYNLSQPSGLSATIAKAPLSISITGNPTKTYNGTTAASLTSGNYSLSGFIGMQSATVNQTSGTYSSADAGTVSVSATLSAGNYSPGSGTSLSNYTLPTSASGMGAINPKPLTATITGDPTKTYDGTTNADLTSANYLLSGFIGTQSASVGQTAGTYSSADAGSRNVTATLNAGNFTPLNGANLSDYVLPTSASGAGTISPAPITAVIGTDPTKTYDGTTAATLGSADYTLTGFVSGQGATVTQTTGTYASADAGSRGVSATLSAGNFTAAGSTNLSDYTLPTSASGTGAINPKPLTAIINGDPTKTYDSTTAATLTPANYMLSGFVGAQGATVGQTAGTYAGPDAGSQALSATLSALNFTPTGSTNLSDYVLPTSASGTGTINPKPLTATITGDPTKIYDGTTLAALTSTNYLLSGFVGAQGATVGQTSGAYSSADAGSRTVAASLTPGDFTATGSTNLSDYVLPTSASGTGAINAKQLTATITGDPTKTYDGAAAATLVPGDYTLNGFVTGQGATVTQIAGNYDAPDAGARTVSTSLASGDFTQNSGTNLSNYILPTAASGAGTIDQKQLTAAITGNPAKIYDGGTTATLAPGDYTLNGFVSGQGAIVTQNAGTYDAADAGSRTVSASLASGDFTQNNGTNLANYLLPSTASGAGTIDQKQLTAAITGNPTKTYDASTAATLAPGDYTLNGFVTGQGATVTQIAGSYDASDAGARNVSTSFAPADFTQNNGTDLSNYILPTSASGAGTINQRQLSAAITGDPTKTYDGGTVATLSSGDYALSGFVSGQGATVIQTAGAYDAPDAGARMVSSSLTASAFTQNNGTNLANYLLPSAATGAGTINQKQLTVAITGNPSRNYDGASNALLNPANYALGGFVPGQSATVTQTAGTYDSPDAGPHGVETSLGAIDFSAANGTNLANYILPSAASGTGSINPQPLTATIVNASKIYDGSTAALLGPANYLLTGSAPGQGATVSQTSGTYTSADAGARGVTAALSASELLLTGGANPANYVFPTVATGTGLISQKPLTVAITGMPGKVYDGTTVALLGSGDYTFYGLVPGQGVTVTQSSGMYDIADAGSRTVSAILGSFLPAAGTSLDNYILPLTASGPGIIQLRPLTATIIGMPTKMKDGTLAATLTPGNFTLNGFVPGQGANVTQTGGTYDATDAGARTVTALLSAPFFTAIPGTLLSNYLLPASATGAGLITPAVLVNAPTLAAAIGTNMTIRSLAPAPQISAATVQAVIAVAVPRFYIPYPSPSALSTWQNNGFGSLPTIVSSTEPAVSAPASDNFTLTTGSPLINTTEQILLQGGTNKSWQIYFPPAH